MKDKEFKAEIKWVDPKSITPYANNAKKHPVHQIDKIAGQIAAFGFDQPIVVDTNKVIIKGHGRREAAIRLGLKEVPIIVSKLDEHQARAARLADNKIAEGDLDTDMLKFELGTLERNKFDLTLTGFEMPEIDKIMQDLVEVQDSVNDVEEPMPEELKQFIVAVECEDEEDMQNVFKEMTEKGYICKLLT